MGSRIGLVLSMVCVVAAGCGAAPGWRAYELASIGRFDAPECTLADPASGAVYVSNIATAKQEYWVDDGTGFISRLKPGGAPDAMKWKDSAPDLPLNGPKGMCIVAGRLYVADNTRVVCYPLAGDEPGRRIEIPGARRLNDMAADGTSAYVSDTATGKIYGIDPQGKISELKGPPSANGITFFKGRMFGVSWDLHEVYELDPTGKEEPKPFGLAKHFKNLDGIEVLDDGTFLVSDFTGGKVFAVSSDRKTVQAILSIRSPADIGLDRQRSLLYVPSLQANVVSAYKLEWKK
jgi:DNA-binding beta-propeller fold protein YncE